MNLGLRFVRACAVEMHADISQFFARLYRKNAAPQNLGQRFVRACAVEMHMDISQEQLYARIHRKKAGDQRAYPDLQ